MTNINAAFQWKCQPHAENIILKFLNEAQAVNPMIASLEHDLLKQTNTRLFDWIDHIAVGYSSQLEMDLDKAGFISDMTTPTYRVYHHPGAQLPLIVVKDHSIPIAGIAVSVESIADFLMVRGRTGWIEGTPLSSFRRCNVATDHDVTLWVVERRGTRTMEATYPDEGYLERYTQAMEQWQTRPRDLEDEEEALSRTINIAQELVSSMGEDIAAWIVLEYERKYWQVRNTAGQIQKNRQDRLGMGWANHDHHTFRSSRRHFSSLVRLFEVLGFCCRERFYAGEEAGWGAQVMENPRAKLVLFLDVDLAPHELEINFAHHPLPDLPILGTIGLWCELHGDSILKAGMHHLEAQFMFDDLVHDMAHLGVGMMDPFSNFPYLKQAFTSGEVWHVDPRRIEVLLQRDLITLEQADKFQKYGAVGSHMENLQRREGYKGFNQKNVSFIIAKTDPRKI
jgi:hypothetical protein